MSMRIVHVSVAEGKLAYLTKMADLFDKEPKIRRAVVVCKKSGLKPDDDDVEKRLQAYVTPSDWDSLETLLARVSAGMS